MIPAYHDVLWPSVYPVFSNDIYLYLHPVVTGVSLETADYVVFTLWEPVHSGNGEVAIRRRSVSPRIMLGLASQEAQVEIKSLGFAKVTAFGPDSKLPSYWPIPGHALFLLTQGLVSTQGALHLSYLIFYFCLIYSDEFRAWYAEQEPEHYAMFQKHLFEDKP